MNLYVLLGRLGSPPAAWPSSIVIFVKSRVEIYSPRNASPGAGFSLFHTEALKLQPALLLQSCRNLKASVSFQGSPMPTGVCQPRLPFKGR